MIAYLLSDCKLAHWWNNKDFYLCNISGITLHGRIYKTKIRKRGWPCCLYNGLDDCWEILHLLRSVQQISSQCLCVYVHVVTNIYIINLACFSTNFTSINIVIVVSVKWPITSSTSLFYLKQFHPQEF